MSKALVVALVAAVIAITSAITYVASSLSFERSVTIEGGPKVGFFYATGEDLASWLTTNGVETKLVNREDTLEIISDVNDPQSPVDVGFMAQKVDAKKYPNVVSLGSIVNEPLLFFARSELGTDLTINDLAYKRVSIGAPASGVYQLAEAVIDAYGLTASMKLSSEPSGAGVEQLLAGEIDALALLLPPQTPIITELALNPNLTLVNLPSIDALATQIGYVQPTVIPQGGFSLMREIPPAALDTIGIPVTVIAKKDLPRGNAYLILERLNEKFSDATLTSRAGEFPNFVDVQVPPDAAASNFLRSGTPWQFHALPHVIAEALVPLLLVGSLALIIGSIYKLFFPDFLKLWAESLSPLQSSAMIDKLEAQTSRGEPLSPRQLKKVERLIAQLEAPERDKARAMALRASAPDRARDLA